jgi:hypothetical protein
VPVYVLGPSSAISSAVFREVAKIDKRVRRVSGEDPVENAIALARYSSGGFGWNVNDPGHGFVVARSDSPLAAAVAAPLSASGTWGPLLLSDDADTLPKPLREDRPAGRTGPDRRGTVSEAENPELLGHAHRVTAEDIRALAGASTPHFALQVRNRIRRLIEPLDAADPARLEGERKIAELEDLAEHSGDPRGTMGIGHR